jgi:hypothetical protein
MTASQQQQQGSLALDMPLEGYVIGLEQCSVGVDVPAVSIAVVVVLSLLSLLLLSADREI